MVYLALGDSYTIGTGASRASRNFPSLLAARVQEATGQPVRVVNPAVNGFTTIDLIAHELGNAAALEPRLVSVLIGVNDLVRGRRVDEYRQSVVEIYDAIAELRLADGCVVAVSIPDWSVVPAARDFGDPSRIRRLTGLFNEAAHAEASARAFTWVDITVISRAGLGSPGWIAADGLHPGDLQYEAWAGAIWAAVGPAWSRP